MEGSKKFFFRPKYGLSYYFDRATDPGEHRNRVAELTREEIEAAQRELIDWYFYQVEHIRREFPLENW